MICCGLHQILVQLPKHRVGPENVGQVLRLGLRQVLDEAGRELIHEVAVEHPQPREGPQDADQRSVVEVVHVHNDLPGHVLHETGVRLLHRPEAPHHQTERVWREEVDLPLSSLGHGAEQRRVVVAERRIGPDQPAVLHRRVQADIPGRLSACLLHQHGHMMMQGSHALEERYHVVWLEHVHLADGVRSYLVQDPRVPVPELRMRQRDVAEELGAEDPELPQ
mmetsp:Transcript_98168/g.253878  ORF Transcript_98168/g.253878 Transcript_98168/m.253878 type:complete len:222 (+) Transcript_98168:705-1370(+)